MELVLAGFGSLADEVFHGQCAVEENAEAFESERGMWYHQAEGC